MIEIIRYPLLTADEALLCTLWNWLKAESEAERSEKERFKMSNVPDVIPGVHLSTEVYRFIHVLPV